MPMLQGTAQWAKIVGEPQPDYNKTGKEWSIDVKLDDASISKYKQMGGGDAYVRASKDDGTPYIRFTRKSVTADGSPAKPIRIVDSKGEPWDGKTLIGNGSTVNIKFALNDITMGVNKGQMKPSLIAVQVWKLEPYKSHDFPVNDEDEGSDNETWTEDDE